MLKIFKTVLIWDHFYRYFLTICVFKKDNNSIQDDYKNAHIRKWDIEIIWMRFTSIPFAFHDDHPSISLIDLYIERC